MEIYWVRRGKGIRKWDVLTFDGKHIMSHDFLCDAQGVGTTRGGQSIVISERSSQWLLLKFWEVTGLEY